MSQLKGITKTGFQFEVSQDRLENYELVEALAELDENTLALPKVVNLLLGKEQAMKLKDHIRSKDGIVSGEKMSNEIKDIFEKQKQTKN